MKWLGTAGVAERIGATPRQVRERYALRPDFPVPMRPGGRGHPKWRVDEIDAWCESQRPKPPELEIPRGIELPSSYPEYNTWKKMHYRCNNPKSDSYKWYGARGVTVCERWNSFVAFISDMGRRPTPKHSIDRIDNYGNYEPNNCRWATVAEQYANRRCPRCDHVSHG